MRALSLKQPWATLLAHGVKTIEIRSWPNLHRGQTLIHAAKVPEDRKEAWDQLPGDLHAQAKLVGGFVGIGNVTGIKRYKTVEEFAKDQEKHHCPLEWFKAPMYGFIFEEVKLLDFHPCKGWMRFFEVPAEVLREMGLSTES